MWTVYGSSELNAYRKTAQERQGFIQGKLANTDFLNSKCLELCELNDWPL